jgi:hypothetical protein
MSLIMVKKFDSKQLMSLFIETLSAVLELFYVIQYIYVFEIMLKMKFSHKTWL